MKNGRLTDADLFQHDDSPTTVGLLGSTETLREITTSFGVALSASMAGATKTFEEVAEQLNKLKVISEHNPDPVVVWKPCLPSFNYSNTTQTEFNKFYTAYRFPYYSEESAREIDGVTFYSGSCNTHGHYSRQVKEGCPICRIQEDMKKSFSLSIPLPS